MSHQKSSTCQPRAALAVVPAAVLCFTVTECAHAQALTDQSLEERLNTLMKVVDQQQRKIDALEHQVIDLEMARRGRGEPGGPTTAAPPMLISQYTPITPAPGEGTGTATGVPVNPPPPQGAGETAAPGTIGTTQKASEPGRTAAEEAVVQREHSPLFDRKLTIDWGISDTYYDRRQLQLSGFLALDAIFLGNLNLGQTKSHQLMSDVDVRYGLTDRISVDVDVPYMYRTATFMNGGAGGAANTLSDTSVNSHALGDVNFGIYYQFVKEHGSVPDVVGSLRVKAPTGTAPFGIKLLQSDPNNTNLVAPSKLPTGNGFWSLTAGVSVLKTYDPVVLFGRVSYTYNVAR